MHTRSSVGSLVPSLATGVIAAVLVTMSDGPLFVLFASIALLAPLWARTVLQRTCE